MMVDRLRWSEELPSARAPGQRLSRSSLEAANLDITPMIDITFLLLIFFLVASRPDTQIQAELPDAHHGMGVGKRSSIIFTVAQSGQEVAPIYLGDGKIPKNKLPRDPAAQRDRIQQYVRDGLAEGKRDVLIEADKGVAYRDIARVVNAASQVEGIKLHFAVFEKD
jgi:biopolymer transport protein ExbD